jgi:phosphocarrier protein HPr
MASSGPVHRSFEIKNKLGLHARAAVQVVQLATKFDAEVSVTKDGQTVNGKSIIGLMMLAAAKGQAIDISADGPQAEEALDALGELIERCFDEEE